MQNPIHSFLWFVITSAPLVAQTFTFTKVADTVTPVPGGTGTFAAFTNMVSTDANGNVAFGENNGTTNNGVYLSSSGVLSRVADLNTSIPGGTGKFTGFALFGNAIDGGRLAFRGNGSDNQAGIYAYASGSLIKIADTKSAIPGGNGNFTGFGTAYVDSTNYAFIGPGDSGQQGLYVSNGSAITRIADKISTVPGIGGTYGWSAQVGYDAGNLAFWANVTGGTNPGSIVGGYTSAKGLITLASTATAAPGAGSNFTGFTSPVDLSGDTVAFRGQYGASGQGIFTVSLATGVITTICDLSTAVPEGSGNFIQVQNPTITSGGVAFLGSFPGGSGIYFHQKSVLRKVIDTTDLLNAKTISSFGLSENSLADGYLAFRVNFTDSSAGIYRTSFTPELADRRPDALIRNGNSGAFIGNDVYNSNGASQSRTQTAKAGQTIIFNLSIQNDGTASDSFKVKASGSNSNQYTVSYYSGSRNVTAEVVKGSYATKQLAPGASVIIKAKVNVKSRATKGSKVARLLTATSAASSSKKDAVQFIVKRAK